MSDEVLMRRLITINGPRSDRIPKRPKSEWRKMYDEGSITFRELQMLCVEWSTDASGRQFYYVCPKCSAPMTHCPDPACAEEGVGHHLLEEDNEKCGDDVSYKTALMYYKGVDEGKEKHYTGWCVSRPVLDQISKEINEAIQGVLAKYATKDYPEGCEFHGELIGLLQQKNAPETAIGQYIKVGNGMPETWIGPLPGKYRQKENDDERSADGTDG